MVSGQSINYVSGIRCKPCDRNTPLEIGGRVGSNDVSTDRIGFHTGTADKTAGLPFCTTERSDVARRAPHRDVRRESNRAWNNSYLNAENAILRTGHADFQSGAGSSKALYFKELPGRPLPSLQYNAGLYTASSRKTHAKLTQKREDLKSQSSGVL